MKYSKRQSPVGAYPTPSPFAARAIKAKAKLDFIKFRLPSKATGRSALMVELDKWRRHGQLFVPKRQSDDSLTLHDPKPAQLQFLVDHYPEGHITAIEVTVDFFPTSSAIKRNFLPQVHEYFRHGLFPTALPMLTDATRKFYDPDDEKVKRDPLKASTNTNTTYWRNRTRKATLRLYIKREADRGVFRRFVRVEVLLNRGGCQDLELYGFALLPEFLAAIGQRTATAFTLARGLKFNPATTRSTNAGLRAALDATNARRRARLDARFSCHGAMWCEKHGLPIARDTEANGYRPAVQTAHALRPFARVCPGGHVAVRFHRPVALLRVPSLSGPVIGRRSSLP